MFLIIIAVIVIICVVIANKNKKEIALKQEQYVKEHKEEYDKVIENYNLRKDEYLKNKNHILTTIHDFKSDTLYMVENKSLCILPNRKICTFEWFLKFDYDSQRCNFDSDIKEEIIDFDSIKYFQLAGSIDNELSVYGGGGGGSSIKGAVVGGLIAGEAGAIIGSRKSVDSIHSSHSTVDNRQCWIILKDNTKKVCDYKVYELLLDYIPKLEYENVMKEKKSNID